MRAVADRGLERDFQAMRDFLGGESLSDQAKYFDLARCELFDRIVGASRVWLVGRSVFGNVTAFLDCLESLPEDAARFGNKLSLQSAVLQRMIQAIARF